MKFILLGLGFMLLSGCMYVKIDHCGGGNVNVNLDKAVSTLPLDFTADSNTVPVSALP